MIDFACKRFSLDEVIKCSLGLTKAEFAILKHFIKQSQERFSTKELAEALAIDQSTVQRAVKKLHEKNVLDRYQINLDGGGYLFTYQLKGKAHLRRIIKNIIQGWVATVEDALAKL
ncbi:MarR family transcriptional regulator [Candidatus Woesearchaeota archaeon]|nr:MAG: MarR family transcriptional regulator [Candidatus Woesearchaeota archaeon]